MAKEFDDLEILKLAEEVSDSIWSEVTKWKPFEKDTVGKQFARAADSIGANLAEAYGRFHFGEKLSHVFYARGSLFEIKFWINRAAKRGLLPEESVRALEKQLVGLARGINSFAKFLKQQRSGRSAVKEPQAAYNIFADKEALPEGEIFSAQDLAFLQTMPNNQ